MTAEQIAAFMRGVPAREIDELVQELNAVLSRSRTSVPDRVGGGRLSPGVARGILVAAKRLLWPRTGSSPLAGRRGCAGHRGLSARADAPEIDYDARTPVRLVAGPVGAAKTAPRRSAHRQTAQSRATTRQTVFWTSSAWRVWTSCRRARTNKGQPHRPQAGSRRKGATGAPSPSCANPHIAIKAFAAALCGEEPRRLLTIRPAAARIRLLVYARCGCQLTSFFVLLTRRGELSGPGEVNVGP